MRGDFDEDEIEDFEPDQGDYCARCSGCGYYHDCGDDTCCCADPDTDDLVTCPDCNGTGVA